MQQAPLNFQSYGVSDVGLVRSNNEDMWNFLTKPPFFVLADGMGGHKAGEVAAKMAVDSLCETFLKQKEPISIEELAGQLKHAIAHANASIFTLGQKDEYSGMGTTLCCLFFYQNSLVYAHVGDSRIYRFRNNQLEQLTEDHSLRRELYLKGELNSKEALLFPKNVISRAIGTMPAVEPDLAVTAVFPNDIYFLCSDGLTDHLSNDEIANYLKESISLEKAADTLVDAAKAKGGTDNITIVMVKASS